jgi:hypothetical protein
MRMAPRAAAWVAWAEWICNCRSNGSYYQERAGFAVRSFFLVARCAMTALVDPFLENVRGDAHCKALLSKMNMSL